MLWMLGIAFDITTSKSISLNKVKLFSSVVGNVFAALVWISYAGHCFLI